MDIELDSASARSLIEQLPVPIAHCRLLRRSGVLYDVAFIAINAAFATMAHTPDLAGRRLSELAPDVIAELPRVLELLASVAPGATLSRWEQSLPSPRVWTALRVGPLADDRFVLIASIAPQPDRPRHEPLEQSLTLGAALAAMTDAVAIADASGRYVAFNAPFARYHRFASCEDYARALAENPACLELRMEDGTQVPMEQWVVQRALRGESGSNLPYQLRRKDTGEAWAGSYSFGPIRDSCGAITGAIVSARDVTAEKLVREQLGKLSLVVEQSAESVMITDLAGRIEYVNAAFALKTGYAAAELIGRDARELFREQVSGPSYREIEVALHTGGPWKGEIRGRRKDGREFVDLAAVSALIQPGGRITHYAVLAEDVTERRRMDAELLSHRLHLTELVEQRTAELAVAKDAAESAARAKSAFLAGMSHELRTPLSAVLGIAQLALFRELDARTRTDFGRILDSGRHLLALLDDVLDLSKIDAGKLGLRSSPASPSRIVNDAAALFAAEAASRGIGLSATCAPDLPAAVFCDVQRLQQILLNLISNALKFTPSGRIAIRARRDGSDLAIEVRDTGIGIAPEDLQRIFEPFEQAPAAGSDPRTGTGLGLAISRRLAELMGGSLSVRSEPGVGSIFTVTLPLRVAEGRGEISSASGLDLAGALQGTRILAVDDHAVSRLVLEEALRMAGATVITAADGLSAVELVRRHGRAYFDLVLIDVRMPRMDGCEATRAIHGVDPELPVVGQTAHVAADEHARCRAAGMCDVLSKPIHLAELVGRVPGWTSRGHEPISNRIPEDWRAATPGARGAIDWDSLHRLYGERSEVLGRLVRTAIDSNSELPSELRRCAAAGDRLEIQAAAHFIRSGAVMMEAHGLATLAAQVEAACQSEAADLGALAKSLADAVEAMTDELREHLAR